MGYPSDPSLVFLMKFFSHSVTEDKVNQFHYMYKVRETILDR